MEKKWRSVTIIIDWNVDKGKKRQRTLAGLLNYHKIKPSEMVILQKRTVLGQLVIDALFYDIEAPCMSNQVVLSGF